VLAGASRKALVRRREVALVLLGSDPHLSTAPQVGISFCLLNELKMRGPFAPIFHAVGDSEREVDWLGEGGDDAEPVRSEEAAR
jgi:uracil DNA glycosylase